MLLLFMTFFISLALASLVFSAILLISKKVANDLEKASPFECGFNPQNKGRVPISLQFFLIALIFLIFDMELILLFPFLVLKSMSSIYDFYSLLMFFSVVSYGLYMEWSQNMLEWVK